MKRVRIRAEPVLGRDLDPGDLFSSLGQDYWEHFGLTLSVGEKVYVRTNMPASLYPDRDKMVYRLHIIVDPEVSNGEAQGGCSQDARRGAPGEATG